MKIDRNNYEIFFVEYLDGTLPVEQIDDMLDFLQKNPDLANELKDLEKIKLDAPEEIFPLKNSLKRSDLDMTDLFEETCIRSIEGDLSAKEESDFKRSITKNKRQKATFDLYQATISEPNLLITYPKKEQLRKSKNRIIAPIWYAVAASIVLGAFIFISTDNRTNNSNTETVANVINETYSTPKEEVTPQNQLIIESTIKKPNQKVENTLLAENKSPENIEVKEIEEQPIAHNKIETLTPRYTLVSKEEEKLDFERFQLAEIKTVEIINSKDYSKYLTVKQLLAMKGDELWSKVKSGELNILALKSLRKASDDKIRYSTTTSGKIKAIGYESKLLAFSIPISNE